MNRSALLALFAAGVLAAAPVWARQASDGCIETFDPQADYFADKAEVEVAEGFMIDYFDSYKLLTVTQPWQGAAEPFRYLLVQCGAPDPEGYADAVRVTVPVQSVVTMSTTYLPPLVELGLLDHLVGVDEFDYVYSAAVRERIDAGQVREIGGGSTVNVEQAIDLAPDVIFTYGIGSADYDAAPGLQAAGLTAVLNGDYMETQPLGRAEWVKFIAAFFNAEGAAQTLFDEIAGRYRALAEQAATAEARPTVMVNGMYGDTWYVAGGASYTANLIADAGGAYLWADDDSSGGLPLSLEAVLERAEGADVWLNPNYWLSLADGLAEDERYALFAPFSSGRVYNNVRRITATGGNDYGESGALRPDLLLADLIGILHPDLLPEHELYFYVELQ